ncbi:SDR family oxidoreductase [Rhodopseudomonas palustris]|uniref:SDR family oxidoreductase n=1 Tax=Rhodopseudomonas palustris TaxID=1076 RepID=UPI000E5AE83E|nr:SDR family oxidoreductase [Rhodopseudomonas palustris]QLH71736.1 SDR family oxidoreductase [Rhodopseudomonas palustris]RIA02967.1 SDR family oxidoreductase [Rhodopseudomonas palustris]
MSASRFLITGASGQLGRLVVDGLLKSLPPAQIGVLVRSEKVAAEFAAKGLHVHIGDYSNPETLGPAFAGVERALLISSSEIGQRAVQHRNAIEAARAAGVSLLAYTSLLHADISPLGLAEEHRQTEAALKASGVPHALLRNGWYSENYTTSIPAALAHGALLGSAGNGRIASAARADYAEAAVRVLTAEQPQAGRIYELAGDAAYTLAEFAAKLSQQSGKAVAYRDLPQAEYEAALVAAGLPKPFAALLADSDAGAAKGALFDDSQTLSQLIGHPTTPIATTISAALKA